eukprot:gene21800-51533_t
MCVNALHNPLRHAAADAHIRALLITGQGRFFCAGADLSEGALDTSRKKKKSAAAPPASPEERPNLFACADG